MKKTFLDAVRESLICAMSDCNTEDLIQQRVVIFPDKNRDWEPIVVRLRETLPIITLGEYNPVNLTGPTIYLRSLVARTVSPSPIPADQTPIVYLPGYSREQLRNLEDCPDEIKPLAGLQHLGVVWSQRNGRDWTIPAFLKTSQGGLSIRVNDDQETRDAIKNSASVLADESIELLRSKEPLNAAFFAQLHHHDPNKQILQWMNGPTEEEQRMKVSGDWGPFCKICKKEYELDPEKEGVTSAAEKLGKQDHKWMEVWERFKEKPMAYPKIPALLRNTKQPSWMVYPDSWPQYNDAQENELYLAFLQLGETSPDNARSQLQDLEKRHAQRRDWIWAEMGESPLALALEHLSVLAKITKETKFGGTVNEQAERYTRDLWKADYAVVRALEHAKNHKGRGAIGAAVNILYKIWSNTMAEAFQQEWLHSPDPSGKENREPIKGEVILFIDGFRMDLGHRLSVMMEDEGCTCDLSYHFSALPTETSTAKPAVMPIAGELASGDKLIPKTQSGASANITALRKILEEKGFTVLSNTDTGDPTQSAWTDCANIDDEGHSKGIGLPLILDREIKRIRDRIFELFDAGWKQVRVVTDHGWLLLPGGLHKTELKVGLTELKKARYAQLRTDAEVNLPVVPWFWDRNIRIALAPGTSCFEEGKEYAHGGLSPQETVVPDIRIIRGVSREKEIQILDLSWSGLRCRVHIKGAEGFSVDIRLNPADPKSSITTEGKHIDIEGNASLIIEDDSMEGKTASFVVLDSSKTPVAQREIRIGGE